MARTGEFKRRSRRSLPAYCIRALFTYYVIIYKQTWGLFGEIAFTLRAGVHFLQDCMCAQRRFRSACASAQSDQSIRCPSKDALDHYYPRSFMRRLWSVCADAQAGLSLGLTHMQSCKKRCAMAQLWYLRQTSYIYIQNRYYSDSNINYVVSLAQENYEAGCIIRVKLIYQ